MNNINDRKSIFAKKLENNHALFYTLMFAFLALFFVRDIFNVTVLPSVFLGLSFLICIVSDRSELLAFGCSLSVLSFGFQYKYCLFICMLVYILKYTKDIKINKSFLCLLMLMSWELLHGTISQFSLLEYFRNFAELIFLCFLSTISFKKIEYHIAIKSFMICLVIMATIILISAASTYNYDVARMYLSGYRLGWIKDPNIEYAIYTNPNSLAFLCNAALALIGIEYLNGYKSKIYYLISCYLLVIGVMTLSRTFWVILLVLGLCMIMFAQASLQKKIKNIVIVLSMVVLSLFIIYYITPEIFNRTMFRIETNDNAGGRVELFLLYGELIFSSLTNFFFGLGLQNSEAGLSAVHGIMPGSVSHNGVEQIILLWGMCGFLMFLKFIQVLFFSKNYHVDNHYILFFILIVYVQAGQLITSGITLMVLCLSYFLVKASSVEKVK